MSREWHFFVDDMIDFAETAMRYTANMTFDDFVTNRLVYDATVRNLELIGEAATHIPDEKRGLAPEVDWRLIVATRNRLIHGYLGIDNRIVWSIVQDTLPETLPTLRRLLESTKS